MSNFEDWVIPIYGLLLVFYLPFLWYIRKMTQARYARRRFCRGLVVILDSSDPDTSPVSQVQILYKRLSDRYNGLPERFRSATEMVEDLLVTMDTSTPKDFKAVIGVEPPLDRRRRLLAVLEDLKREQPFSSLTAKSGNLLNTVRHAVETENRGLAATALRQLGDEVEVLEANLRQQERRTQFGFALSIVGVVLTFFFGVLSFVQFLRP